MHTTLQVPADAPAQMLPARSLIAVECGWITTEVGRQPWIVYENMRVAEAVTSTRSGTLWTMFGLVVVVYVFIFGSFLAILLRMRTRWRLADGEDRAGTGARASAETPETDTPLRAASPRPVRGCAALRR